MHLSDSDRLMLVGGAGEATQLAMRIIVEMGNALGAAGLRDVTSAHIDGCLYHGQAGLDFAEHLVKRGGKVSVPTTLNVGSIDLLHPHFFQGDKPTQVNAKRLMDAYVALGGRPTWTCAPYQLPQRPSFGEHIAWAESNAIVFANSVLGARTNRYGDFVDICAAITGRVPDAGLHKTENRRGQVVFQLRDVKSTLLNSDVLYPVLGHLVGTLARTRIPVVDGLPGTSEDNLKALGAAAASAGSVALFHVTGITPEAPTLREALQGAEPEELITVTPDILATYRDSLSTNSSNHIDAVSIGTPHFSTDEFGRLMPLLQTWRKHRAVDFFISTSRHVRSEIEARGWLSACESAGIEVVVDTCTYVTPILRNSRVVMTNSAKWAYYAPGNLGVDVVFGSLEECVRSAQLGRVWRDPELWTEA